MTFWPLICSFEGPVMLEEPMADMYIQNQLYNQGPGRHNMGYVPDEAGPHPAYKNGHVGNGIEPQVQIENMLGDRLEVSQFHRALI